MLKKIVKNICLLLLFAIILVVIFTFNLNKYPSNLDELWNYNTARCFMNNMIPYKEISMITTTLLPAIIGLVLKIFGDELIIFRICTAIMGTLILFVTYKILKQLIKNEICSITTTLILLCIYFKNFTLDYNYFVLLIFLIIEFILLKRSSIKFEKQKYINILIGFLAGCAICTKHTVGLVISAFLVILEIGIADNKKTAIQNIIHEIIGICIPVGMFIIVRICTNSLNDFISYSILGIKTFTNSIPYTKLIQNEDLFVATASLVVPILTLGIIIYSIYIKIKKQEKYSTDLMICALLSIPMMITVYPIADKNHFLIAVLPALICCIYVIICLLKELYSMIKWEYKKYILLSIECFVIMLIIVKSIQTSYINYGEYTENLRNNSELQKELSHYTNIPQYESTIQKTLTFKKFIENKKQENYIVYICDAEACVYDIPINVYNKNYDMFLKGNIGKDGEDGIIEDIRESEKTIYLIKGKNQSLNWQTPTKVIDYIRDNLKEGEHISNFVAYYKE